ncbi:hypothetical protein D8B22_20025 [Verminephrobacter aporrectodeae subsp. tuberculatae]|uniref:choice-of-anchor U domain-containing protein n=1 Tax=Verminephrobacter aporrectodeae TaxID=1110389 RepID=UPI002242E5BE|nr:choice-of-anchor U domain-containing protein [Verminephrobacter aporrectodeae]MCW8167132.1 hypothetical protein [Verminephrobacter aporrectodeae subsp. tuberculatae]MCW8171328.1 hypothetical protein [Verminephrobacter aporrectodeae subsp. tuberculatae]
MPIILTGGGTTSPAIGIDTGYDTVIFTIRFNQGIMNFEAADVLLTKSGSKVIGVASVPENRNADGSSDVWRVTLQTIAGGNAASTANDTIGVRAGSITDHLGNPGPDTDIVTPFLFYRTDYTKPILTGISLAKSSLSAGETTTVTFTFSERTTNFTARSVALSDGCQLEGANAPKIDGNTVTPVYDDASNLDAAHSAACTVRINGVNAVVNNLSGFTHQNVSNLIADTTAPVLDSATVSGRDLVLSYTEASSKMVQDGQSLRLDFRIKDGGAFDADGETDGIITAPGTAAHMLLSIVGQTSDAQAHGIWF